MAKRARELDPENPRGQADVLEPTASRCGRSAINKLMDDKEKGVWEALQSVEESAIPFDDRDPYQYAGRARSGRI